MPSVPVSSFAWRQWKIVGDLFPEKHQATIDELAAVAADADDEHPTPEAYFNNLKLLRLSRRRRLNCKCAKPTYMLTAQWINRAILMMLVAMTTTVTTTTTAVTTTTVTTTIVSGVADFFLIN